MCESRYIRTELRTNLTKVTHPIMDKAQPCQPSSHSQIIRLISTHSILLNLHPVIGMSKYCKVPLYYLIPRISFIDYWASILELNTATDLRRLTFWSETA